MRRAKASAQRSCQSVLVARIRVGHATEDLFALEAKGVPLQKRSCAALVIRHQIVMMDSPAKWMFRGLVDVQNRWMWAVHAIIRAGLARLVLLVEMTMFAERCRSISTLRGHQSDPGHGHE